MSFHIQPRQKGYRRERLSPYVLPDVRRKIEDLARRYNVKPSWVIATIINDAFHVKGQKPYTEAEHKRRKRGRNV